MSVIPLLVAAAGSSVARIVVKFLSTPKHAERYLNYEISFEEATDSIVKNIRIYVPLTTAKVICDAIVLGMTGKWIYEILSTVMSIFKGLINCGLQAFQNGIITSLNHFFTSLRDCSITLILTQFKHFYDKRRKAISPFTMNDFCNFSNSIHLIIICSTNGLTKTVQLELMQYWLECMGIIRAIAESHNINFVKYMDKFCPRKINASLLNNEHSSNITELQWELVKDPDFTQIVTVSLEDVFRGVECIVIVKREIRDVNKRVPEIEEARYLVVIEPGCPDGKTFRFIEAGHQDPVNIPGDLIVEIRTGKHPLFERLGSDLIYITKILLNDELERVISIQVPMIDGSMKECNQRGVISSDTEIIIDHAGLPDPTNDGIRGRFIVKFDIEFPDAILGTQAID